MIEDPGDNSAHQGLLTSNIQATTKISHHDCCTSFDVALQEPQPLEAVFSPRAWLIDRQCSDGI